MKSKEDISNEILRIQQQIDQLIMEIGHGYAKLRATGDSKIVPVINSKVEIVEKLTESLDELRQELDRI
jgi:hypothetical protein